MLKNNNLKPKISSLFNHKIIRYIISGGVATLVDIVFYFITYNFILKKQEVNFKTFTISAHIASLILSYSVGMILNFLITKYFVFQNNTTKKREEIGKYLLVSAVVFLGNYLMMKILVEVLKVFPTPARTISAGLVAFGSFYIHRTFTFKQKSANA